jgi:folate-dependent phosphoribosylglycinamide formyltransferase PurN
LNKKDKILIICGNLIKHKYFAIKLLKKFKNSNVIFENYPVKISYNYTPHKSKILNEHFEKVKFYEKNYFKEFCKKNEKFLKKKTFLTVKKGTINSEKVFRTVKKINPNLIILNATSLIKKKLLNSYKNKIINVHAGLIPYYRGAGCNVWTFFKKELEYTGVTVHFVNDKIDNGKILLQEQSKFQKNDNTHTIGCKNAKLGLKLSIETIKYLLENPNYKGKNILTKKNSIFYKKNFNENVVKKINALIKKGLVKDYILNKKEVKLIKLFKKK